MAVQVATLDILTERAHFDPEVARAIGDAIDMELKTSRETLATQQDILDVKRIINELRHDTKQEISDVKQAINELRHETKQDISELRHETKQGIKDLKLSLTQEYAKGKDDITRWMLAITLTMISFVFGLAYYMMQHMH